jgi:hypothetical protein
MVHISKPRAATSEIKFLVDPVVADRIRAWARTHFSPDPYGAGDDADEYETCTLYFDTAELDVFGRRGSYARAKYRVRRYGGGDAIFLERKLRKPGMLIKRRIACPLDGLELLDEAYTVQGWIGEWFHRRLLARRLRPVCQVSYRRMARNLDRVDGTARLTLDSGLRVRAIDAAQFSDGSALPFLESQAILELKFGAHLPAICRRLVEEFALSPHNASKYRLGMAWLGHGERGAHASRLASAGVTHG